MSPTRGNIWRVSSLGLENSNIYKGNHMSKKLKNAPSKKPYKDSGKGRANNAPKSKTAVKKKDTKNG